MERFRYHTKHFQHFDIAIVKETGESIIVSKTEPEESPKIGPFQRPSDAIKFGLERVKRSKE